MSNMISFEIEKQNLKRTDSEKVVDLSQGYLEAKFKVDGVDWSNDTLYDKYALFRYGELAFTVKLGREDENQPIYKCEVPFEILRYDNFILTTYAAGKTKKVRITTNSLKIKVDNSDFTEDVMSTREPSKDAFNAVYEELGKKINSDEVDTKIATQVGEAIKNIPFPEVFVTSDSAETPTEPTEAKKGDIWVNIVVKYVAGETPTVQTVVTKKKHNGTAWEAV